MTLKQFEIENLGSQLIPVQNNYSSFLYRVFSVEDLSAQKKP